jgi:HK97 family phage portal protein
MNIKNIWPFGKSSKNEPEQTGTKSRIIGGQEQILLQPGDFLNYAIGYGQGLTGYETLSHAQAMQIYQQSSSVATAVDIIAQEIERINPVVHMPDGSLDDSHEILSLLQNPNDWNETWSFFIGSLARARLLTGNDYTFGLGLITNPPLELYAVKPSNTNIEAGNIDQRPTAYSISNGDGRGTYTRNRAKTGYRFYDGNLKELWHNQAYSSTTSNLQGDSPLKAICLDVYSQIKGRIHNTSLLDNGGRPSLLVTFKDAMTSDQHIERRDLINEQVSGGTNAGKIIVASAESMDVTELGTNNKDMDYANLERISEHATYKRYRVPLPLISTDALTDNNMAHAVYQLYDFAVLPNTEALLSSLTMFLMPRYGLDPSEYKLTYNPEEIEALKQRQIDTLKKKRELGIESINELREGLPNREPVEGGDTILVSSTMIPITETSTEELPETETAEEEAERLAREAV